MRPPAATARRRTSSPTGVLTGTYDAGFTSRLLEKDLRLYLEAVEGVKGMPALAPEVHALWRRLEAAEPNADITRMYPFVREGRFRESGPS